MHRTDTSVVPTEINIGNIKRRRLFGFTFYQSPDLLVWCIPTMIIMVLSGGATCVGAHVTLASPVVLPPGALRPLFSFPSLTLEVCLFWFLVLVALVVSALCGLTDPGIIPKPSPGSEEEGGLCYEDPFTVIGRECNWKYCTLCHLYRPPRASHCYVCGVCVLEHDHHCGMIGADVGLRSLRFFVTFLFCIAVAGSIAISWLVRSLVMGVRQLNLPTSSPSMSSSSPLPLLLPAGHTAFLTVHIGLLLAIGNIVMLVGGFCIFYFFLICTDQTRREAKHSNPAVSSRSATNNPANSNADEVPSGETSYHERYMKTFVKSRSWRWFGNLGRVMFPPPSLLAELEGKKVRRLKPEERATLQQKREEDERELCAVVEAAADNVVF